MDYKVCLNWAVVVSELLYSVLRPYVDYNSQGGIEHFRAPAFFKRFDNLWSMEENEVSTCK